MAELDPRDREAITELKARYFRYLDTKQWELFRGVFTDDCRYEGTRKAFRGPDEFVSATSGWLQPATTVHHGHMPEIVAVGDGVARGVWAMYDIVEFPEDSPEGPAPGARGFYGFGHYEEEYRKSGGEWRISCMRLTRIRVNALRGDQPPFLPLHVRSSGTAWLSGSG